MSNIIPPLLSSTPPPLDNIIDDEDDDFGAFTTAGADSIPTTPEKVLTIDINSNKDLFSVQQEEQKSFEDVQKTSNSSSDNNFDETTSEEVTTNDDMYSEEPPDLVLDDEDDDEAFNSFEKSLPGKDYLAKIDDSSFTIDDNYSDEEEDGNETNVKNCDDNAEAVTIDSTLTDKVLETCDTSERKDLNEDEDDGFGTFNSSLMDSVNKTEDDTFNLTVENENKSDVSVRSEKANVVNDTTKEDEFGEFIATYNAVEAADNLKTENKAKCELIVDDDFCTFTSVPQLSVANNTAENSSPVDPEEEEDDFGDFSSVPTLTDNGSKNMITTTPSQEFSSFSSEQHKHDDNEDDFGDFTNFQTVQEVTSMKLDTCSPEQAESVIKSMFVECDKIFEDFERYDFIKDSAVFENIKDITDTSALKYHWSKSKSQAKLLKALNIDERNILYGHSLNPMMPKYAATLSSAPLEPVKSTDSTTPSTQPSQLENSINSSSKHSDENTIPSAQFDWNASGLANPLDAQDAIGLLDLQQLLEPPLSTNPELVVPSTCVESDLALDGWDLWLQSVNNTTTTVMAETESPKLQVRKHPDNESVNSLQFDNPSAAETSKEVGPEDEEEDFDDFASYQQPIPSISSNTNTTVSDDISQTDIMSTWSSSTVVLRESHINSVESTDNTKRPNLDWMNAEWLNAALNSKRTSFDDPQANMPDDGLFMARKNSSENTSTEIKIEAPVKSYEIKTDFIPELRTQAPPPTVEEDEFTDFQMKLPEATPNILQPTKLDTLPSMSNQSPKIIWPDPGISEDEIKRLEEYTAKFKQETPQPVSAPVGEKISIKETQLKGNQGTLLIEKSVVVPANKVVIPASNEVLLPPSEKVVISKDLVLPVLDSSPRKYTPKKQDDTEWSDFVSVPDPQLHLSIAQLSNLQKPKQPIPVITPQGLMQTKLPSALPFQPIQPQHYYQPTSNFSRPPPTFQQPSIISNHYASTFPAATTNGTNSYSSSKAPASADDDEWSDFVSVRPAAPKQTASNHYGHVPNIIANPVHNSIPDLDFVSRGGSSRSRNQFGFGTKK